MNKFINIYLPIFSAMVSEPSQPIDHEDIHYNVLANQSPWTVTDEEQQMLDEAIARSIKDQGRHRSHKKRACHRIN